MPISHWPRGQGGWVIAEYDVSDGVVSAARAFDADDPNGAFTSAALDAISKWRWSCSPPAGPHLMFFEFQWKEVRNAPRGPIAGDEAMRGAIIWPDVEEAAAQQADEADEAP